MARMRGIHADVIRGSIGGNTFFANQFHQILIRQRTSPIDPSSTRQGQVRQAFGSGSILYAALTETQQDSWDDYAEPLRFPNPLGPISVPGRQVAVGNLGLREYLETLGETFTASVDTAPVLSGFLTMSPLNITEPVAPGTGIGVSIGNPNAEDINVVIELSSLFGPTRKRFKGPFRSSTLQVLKVDSETTGAADILFGTVGQIVFVRFRAISETGPVRTSRPAILRGTVALSA